MGNPKAFLTVKRKEGGYRPVEERILDFGEYTRLRRSGAATQR